MTCFCSEHARHAHSSLKDRLTSGIILCYQEGVGLRLTFPAGVEGDVLEPGRQADQNLVQHNLARRVVLLITQLPCHHLHAQCLAHLRMLPGTKGRLSELVLSEPRKEGSSECHRVPVTQVIAERVQLSGLQVLMHSLVRGEHSWKTAAPSSRSIDLS